MNKKTLPWDILPVPIIMTACCGAKLFGIMPFGAGAFCALACEYGTVFPACVYLLCTYLFTFELNRLYAACAAVGVMLIHRVLSVKLHKLSRRGWKTAACVTAILAESAVMGFTVSVAKAIASGFVAEVFLYFCVTAVKCVRERFERKTGAVEATGLFVLLAVFGLAFGRARIGVYAVGLAFAAFTAMIISATGFSRLAVGGTAISLGLGLGVSPELAVAFCIAAFTAAAFSALPRAVHSAAATAVFAAVYVLFGADPLTVGWSSLMFACGCVPYVCLPKRAVRAVNAYFDFDGSARLAVRHFINRTRADAGNRMLSVASVFDETARLMSGMKDAEPDYHAMGDALSNKICPYCVDRDRCDEASRRAAFAELCKSAQAGKAILGNIPEFFTRRCVCAAEALSNASAITDDARKRAKERESEDKAKLIVAERLKAIKDVLEEMGRSQALPVGFDGENERRIVAELNNMGVECAEAFVTAEGVTVIVRTRSSDREKIRRAVSACLKRNCEIVSLEKTRAAGWSVASLKKRPAFEAAYARAGLGKNGVSGDSYAFERIGDRFLAALLDGSGTGAAAGENSSAAVELIECFYRAGFDSQSVLTGVNRFLKLPASENYSAADVVVCDLDTATADIIKLGSPPCYIKTRDTVLKVEGSSLPIGVLDEMRPFVTTKRLYPGQMVILVTDGVSDCFNGDELPEYINGLGAFNPEAVANAVVSRALALCGSCPRDDMTAVAFRLFDAPKSKAG